MSGDIPSYNGSEKINSSMKAFAITPHDSTNFTFMSRGIYVGGAGDVAIVNADDTAVTFVGVPAGTILPVQAKRVNDTNTDATSLVGLC